MLPFSRSNFPNVGKERESGQQRKQSPSGNYQDQPPLWGTDYRLRPYACKGSCSCCKASQTQAEGQVQEKTGTSQGVDRGAVVAAEPSNFEAFSIQVGFCNLRAHQYEVKKLRHCHCNDDGCHYQEDEFHSLFACLLLRFDPGKFGSRYLSDREANGCSYGSCQRHQDSWQQEYPSRKRLQRDDLGNSLPLQAVEDGGVML